MMKDNKNFFLALALSLLVMVAWNYFYGVPQMEKQRQTQQQTGTPPAAPAPSAQGTAQGTAGNQAAPGAAAPAAALESREAVLAKTKRVVIDTPSIAGSINLTGGRIDDISLKKYRVTVDPKSANIVLFSPSGAEHAYYAEFGWVAGAGASVPVPTSNTVWTPEGDRLTAEKPLVLSWDNGQGQIFRRTISVDTNAMFTIKDSVENKGGAPVSLLPFSLVSRHGTPETLGFYILHEGAIGFLGDRLQEVGYKEIDKEHQKSWKSTGGFLGITDKYWAAALIPDQSANFDARFTSGTGALKSYQVDTLLPAQTAAPGQTVETTSKLFAGAKEVAAIDNYEKTLGIKRFDLLIDWGWFWYFTKPLFWAMDFFFHLFGNFGVAILLVTVLLKLVFFPLANKSYASMARMKAVQPQMLEIRERYKDDKLKQQQETMELYKREKINPIAGCWPMLIQIPVFFALYKVIFITIEMRHAPFFGWIKDLAAPDPTSLFNLFGLIPVELPHLLHVGIWPLIMGVTMFVQMKMNPEPTDPIQKSMFSWMPIIFTFMLASFPAGLVIYWSWNNLLSIIQQYVIMKRQGVKVELWDNLRGVFAKKKPAPTT